jgi:dienelactone hydrolase
MEFHEQITIGYVFFGFAYFLSLGFWQILAAFQGLRAFSLLPRGTRAGWGYLLVAVIMVLAGAWFFGTRTSEIFSPGPASSEFLFFLSMGLLCALVTTVAASAVVACLVEAGSHGDANPYPGTEHISTELVQGAIYLPTSNGQRWPVVCMVPDPADGVVSLHRMATGLAKNGMAALVIDVSDRERWKYPDVLAVVPQAIGFTERREDLDASRVGVLGAGLGADLVIRAAASDEQIGASVSLSPHLATSSVQPGLDLLREMSYLEAIRWRRLHRAGELVAQLAAREHLTDLGSRSLLVMYGERDRLAAKLDEEELPAGAEIEITTGIGRVGLCDEQEVINSVVSWFERNL